MASNGLPHGYECPGKVDPDVRAGSRGCRDAVGVLRDAGEAMYMTPQNLVEFWSVATRPREKNGLGVLPGQADVIVREIERIFPIVPDTPTIYEEWKSIVVGLAVSGRQVHDARLVAVMRVYGLTHLPTFNLDDLCVIQLQP